MACRLLTVESITSIMALISHPECKNSCAAVQVLTPDTMSDGELAMLQGGPLVRRTAETNLLLLGLLHGSTRFRHAPCVRKVSLMRMHRVVSIKKFCHECHQRVCSYPVLHEPFTLTLLPRCLVVSRPTGHAPASAKRSPIEAYSAIVKGLCACSCCITERVRPSSYESQPFDTYQWLARFVLT
jgi:hypothetical protein